MTPVLSRLARMSARELRCRCAQSARLAAEAVRYACGRERWRRDRLKSQLHGDSAELVAARRALARRDWPGAHAELRAHFRRRTPRFLIHPARREAIAAAIRSEFPCAAQDARRRAEPLLAGRYDLLGYRDLSFGADGAAIDWHFDPVNERRAPTGFWRRVTYLDARVGDHKVIWELNRHQHWLALGRATWLSADARPADARYAARFACELQSWMSANPPLAGINWASMLELALRSISWVWALHFFAACDDEEDAVWAVDLLLGIERQLDQVSRHLSLYFSPNTHLLGEGLALYVCGQALPELRGAGRWRDIGRSILLEQTRAQVDAGGGHAELSTHYHRYALDFYLLALAVSRRTGDAAEGQLAETVSRLAAYCRAMADDRGRLPTIGDDDGGLLFPICGREPADVSDSLSLAASLLDRPELAVGGPGEEVLWMLGGERAALVRPTAQAAPRSQALGASGYVVMRAAPGHHAIVDAGRHGFLNGGHAHADALSMVLTVHGHPLLIDPGTATYTANPALRDRFRSTLMHNTVVVDERSQSEPAGPFHWRSRADAHVEVWRPAAAFDYLEASHDGYAPLLHRRAVMCDGQGLWLVADHLIGEGRHRMDAHWHLDPAWRPDARASGTKSFAHPASLAAAIASTASEVRQCCGDAEGLGWCAPIYGRVVPSLTLGFAQAGEAPFSIVTAIAARPEPSRGARPERRGGARPGRRRGGPAVPIRLSVETLPVAADADDGWHRTAVLVQHEVCVTVVAFATPVGEAAETRSVHRIRCSGGELATDARATLLRLSPSGAPERLALVDGRIGVWTGPESFAIHLPEPAGDLHFDPRAARAQQFRPGPAHP